jgi:hypothetical protein
MIIGDEEPKRGEGGAKLLSLPIDGESDNFIPVPKYSPCCRLIIGDKGLKREGRRV